MLSFLNFRNMKTIIFTTFIVLLNLQIGFSQWQVLDCVDVDYVTQNLIVYGDLGGLCFCSKDTGYYSYSWTMNHEKYSYSKITSNATNSWEQSHQPDYPYYCYTVKGKNIIYQTGLFNITRSFDGGLTWSGFGPVTPDYYSFLFPIDSILYLIKGNKLSKSNGTNWPVVVKDFTPFTPKKCYFTNIDCGYMILSQPLHSNSIIMKTTDGGQNWTTVFEDTTKYVSSIVFPTHQNGYFGGNQLLFKTIDNGMNFLQIQLPSVVNIKLIDFFNDSVGAIVGDSGKVLITKNSGQSWYSEKIGPLNSNTSVGKLYCFNDSIIYAIVGRCIYYRNINEVIDNNGIEVLESVNNLNFFPNPTVSYFIVIIPPEIRNDNNLFVKIYDFTGKLVKNPKIEIFDDKVKIDLNNEAKGIYNVVLSNGKKSYGGRIVFE